MFTIAGYKIGSWKEIDAPTSVSVISAIISSSLKTRMSKSSEPTSNCANQKYSDCKIVKCELNPAENLPLTLYLTSVWWENFSEQYQYNIKQTSDENKEKYQLGDYKLIQYQILQSNIARTVSQKIRRITNEILGIEGLNK